ncbi:exopolysaccharide biosynthesis polyprenyl glycosylphosphotransferase [Nocardioides yefusunii]|uniref:Exopolysaccharide biosynthesis polyprenyl glycosylphosphotransferase n=1 Tax=Nocardioides yefusunii TaxID=2500546 RepID=A0ABW1QW06_9ACTN|nr:exopolysaccharide biosynthesis polyprenyl glycosylphosphotransferase [Nocardioides yefusunii]
MSVQEAASHEALVATVGTCCTSAPRCPEHAAGDARPVVAGPSPLRRLRAELILGTEIVASLLVMTLVAFVVETTVAVLMLVAGVTLVVRYREGRQFLRPGWPRTERVLRDTSVPFCVAALPVAAHVWPAGHLSAALAITLAGTAVAVVGALLRRWIPIAQRVVVVGSAVAIAEAATRWFDSRHVQIVGSLVVDDEFPRVPRPRTGSVVKVDSGRSITRDSLLSAQPDMVLVVPGPGVDAESVRRIGWALEGSTAALAVQSDLDGIAPHRLTSTSYAGASLLHVSPSRAGRLPLLAKSAFDRVFGTLLLLLAGPLLLGLMAAIRLTSPGPAVFRQVRVGIDGKHFTMYKLRTMVATAERDKGELAGQNEGSGVLFKMQADPRITPLGRVLRKFSLDELPQLFNVVTGDMSLVGPRPALPEEVAQYSSLERRRLVAKPGLTGLWQVSGRSDLGWDESVALDNHYTENWRLADDGVILVRTVGAVLRSKGAY